MAGHLRVGIVATEFPPDLGGIETYASEFARELVNRGHEVHVFTLRHAHGEASLPGMKIWPVLSRRRYLDSPVLREHCMDVWHIMNAAYAWVALEMAPVIVSVHGNDFLRPYIPVGCPDFGWLPDFLRFSKFGRWLEARAGMALTERLVERSLPNAHHIVTNSAYTKTVLLEKIKGCENKTSVGLVGVSDDFFDHVRVEDSNCVSRLITVCRLSEPRKNVDMVLRALAELKDEYVFTYTIVGDGPLRQGLEQLTRELGLTDRVIFKGFVSSPELKRLLSASGLFVLTSSIIPGSHEGFGIAYLEANACGTPVLAARLAGAVEAVKEGVSGIFVEEPAVSAIKDAVKSVMDGEVDIDGDVRKAFARGFTWEKVVDHALQYYPDANSVVARNRSGGALADQTDRNAVDDGTTKPIR